MSSLDTSGWVDTWVYSENTWLLGGWTIANTIHEICAEWERTWVLQLWLSGMEYRETQTHVVQRITELDYVEHWDEEESKSASYLLFPWTEIEIIRDYNDSIILRWNDSNPGKRILKMSVSRFINAFEWYWGMYLNDVNVKELPKWKSLIPEKIFPWNEFYNFYRLWYDGEPLEKFADARNKYRLWLRIIFDIKSEDANEWEKGMKWEYQILDVNFDNGSVELYIEKIDSEKFYVDLNEFEESIRNSPFSLVLPNYGA